MKCNGHQCTPRNATAAPCDHMPYDTIMERLSRDPTPVHDDEFYWYWYYAKWQYALNLPGRTAGSYSRNLNHLWAVGAVVLLWNADFVEWSAPGAERDSGETRRGDVERTRNTRAAPRGFAATRPRNVRAAAPRGFAATPRSERPAPYRSPGTIRP